MSGYQALKCIYISYGCCCKTLSFANESKIILDESERWKAIQQVFWTIFFVGNDSDKILKQSDNWNQVLKIKAEKVNTLSEKAITF